MDDAIKEALAKERTIDITTTGRKSGKDRRIEIWFHRVGEQIYISGSPSTRDWYANMVAHPNFVFHLKGSLVADLRARATAITDPSARRDIMSKFDGQRNLDDWVEASPLVEVHFISDSQ